jgi:putative endonuclease
VAECAVVAVYHTYILCSATGVPYVGVTNHLERRVLEHKQKLVRGFTQKYDVNRLVWFEAFGDVRRGQAAERDCAGETD